MKKERKIAMVVKKLSYKEAEDEEDAYWAKTTPEERLAELISLRKMVFGTAVTKLEKVVSQRSIYDEED